jgi:signal transduction histidine kinase
VTGERGRLSEMVELAPFYIIVLRGPDLRVTAFNPQSEGLFAVRNAVGRTLDEVTAGRADGLPAMAREVFHTNRLQVTGRMPLRLPDERPESADRVFVYTLAPTHDPDGRVDGVVVYAEDVSERAAREAIEQRERLALIIDHAEQVALALYDGATGQRIHASPAYLALVARARPAGPADVWPEMDILGSREETARLFQAVMAEGVARRLPEVCVPGASEPEDRYFDFNLIPIKVEAGETQQAAAYMLISAVDITDLARAHGELARLDQLRDQFLTHASHELRAPIVPLRGYTDLIRRTLQRRESDPAWETRLEHYVNRFDAQISYLTRMVDDLFDVARLEHGKFSLNRADADLNMLLEHAAEQTRMISERPPIVLSLPDAPVVASVDEQRLMQVVLNLLHNAVRYAAEGERVDVRLRRDDGPDGAPGFAVIDVQDYGPGIDEAAQQEIFTRFYQAGRDDRGSAGLGLGLYIAREIVTQHGGEITVRSAPGEGSVFTVRLPLAAE